MPSPTTGRKFQPSFRKYDHLHPLTTFREFLNGAQLKPKTIEQYLSAVRRLLGHVEDPTNAELVVAYVESLSHVMQVQLVAPWRYYMQFRVAAGERPVPGLEGTVLRGQWCSPRKRGFERPQRGKGAELPDIVVAIIRRLGKWLESQHRGKDEIPMWRWYRKDEHTGQWTVRIAELGDLSTLPVPVSALLDLLIEHWTGKAEHMKYVLPASPDRPDKEFNPDRLYKAYRKSLEQTFSFEIDQLLDAQVERATALSGLSDVKEQMAREAKEALAASKAADADEEDAAAVPVLNFRLD